MPRIKRVCLFGTSANPPTGLGGHAGIVQFLASMVRDDQSKELLFDEIRVLPVYKHMFTEKRGSLAKFEDRVQLCKLAFESIPNVVVTDDEKICFDRIATQNQIISAEDKANLRVGFVDLLQMLIETNDSCEFTLALGSDTFMDLSCFKWRRSKDIIQMLGGRIVVFRRKGGNDIDIKTLEDQIDQISKEFGETCPNLKSNIRLVELSTLSDISSSIVRSTCDETVISKALDSKVINYIKEKKLYSFSDDHLKQ